MIQQLSKKLIYNNFWCIVDIHITGEQVLKNNNIVLLNATSNQ